MNEKERTKQMRNTAVTADMTAILKAIGKPPVMRNDQTVHPDYPDLVIDGSRWVRTSGRTERYGKYTEGTALHYLVEYEAMNASAAIRRICEITAPHLLPDKEIVQMKPQDRIEIIRKKETLTSMLETIRQKETESENGSEEAAASDADYPPVPEKTDDPLRIKAAKAYALKTDGIDGNVFDYLLSRQWMYVGGGKNRNVLLFPGPQPDGSPGFFYGRSILTSQSATFKPMNKFLPYSKWAWHAGPDSSKLEVYETPPDAAARMSLRAKEKDGMDAVRSTCVLALSVSSIIPLLEYLKTHDVLKIRLCLNNTDNGKAVAADIHEKLKNDYDIEFDSPGRDFETWRHCALGKTKTDPGRKATG